MTANQVASEVFSRATSDEVTLDPQDWDALRALGHRMVDDMFGMLETVGERPVWEPLPEEVAAHLTQAAPHEGEGVERAYADFLTDIYPYPLGNINPRFWGWVMGTGTPLGMLSSMLAAGMNFNVRGGNTAASLVETQVLGWLKELLGYPAEASGLLVSGGSVANLTGLTVARNQGAEIDLRQHGVGAAPRPMTLYASAETHSSVQRAVEVLGLGSESLRLIPCTADFEIDITALRQAITEDRASGTHPFCVVGNAGTTNTGAIDDLNALADLCEREGLWLHVDGTFGALAHLVPSLRPRLAGMERADSLTFDMHKWLSLPYGVGCVLVRDAAAHRAAFAMTPPYLALGSRGPMSGPHWFMDRGIELSRPFRALSVWLSLKAYGAAAFAGVIEQNVSQARYLADLIAAAPELELLAPTGLNVVCFRFVTGDHDEAALDAINQELLLRLQEGGVVLPSNAAVGGRSGIRAAITNHRSRGEDFDLLVAEVQRVGSEVAAEDAIGNVAR